MSVRRTTRAEPRYTGRVTVPVLWDKVTRTIADNESRDLMKLLDRDLAPLAEDAALATIYPEALGPAIEATLDVIYLDLLDHFTVPHVAVRLWDVAEADPETKEFATVAPEMRQFVAHLEAPYCGSHSVYENHAWFGEAAPRLKSHALVALRAGEGAFGVLALASEDAQRFYPEMGTLYLARIGELVGAALARHLTPIRDGGA